jgi:hypothetical protein
VARAAECLLCNCESLSSNPGPIRPSGKGVPGLLPNLDSKAKAPLTRSVCFSNFCIAFLQPRLLRSLTACHETSRQCWAACDQHSPLLQDPRPLPMLCCQLCPPLKLRCYHWKKSQIAAFPIMPLHQPTQSSFMASPYFCAGLGAPYRQGCVLGLCNYFYLNHCGHEQEWSPLGPRLQQ